MPLSVVFLQILDGIFRSCGASTREVGWQLRLEACRLPTGLHPGEPMLRGLAVDPLNQGVPNE
jgi:hypothetical protein